MDPHPPSSDIRIWDFPLQYSPYLYMLSCPCYCHASNLFFYIFKMCLCVCACVNEFFKGRKQFLLSHAPNPRLPEGQYDFYALHTVGINAPRLTNWLVNNPSTRLQKRKGFIKALVTSLPLLLTCFLEAILWRSILHWPKYIQFLS
jgi:hypothetical protein